MHVSMSKNLSKLLIVYRALQIMQNKRFSTNFLASQTNIYQNTLITTE